MKVPFIGPAYENRSIPVSSQRCVNWYPEIEPNEARNVVTLQGCGGLTTFTELSKSPVWGMHYIPQTNLLYVVAGDSLYEVNSVGNASNLGSIGTGSRPVSMASNANDQLGIATGNGYWVYDSSGLDKINDTGGAPIIAIDITFLDGYFVLVRTGQQFSITGINDARTVDPLDTAEVEGNPDDLLAVIQSNRRLWFWGQVSYENYFNSGAADFPIQPVDGGSSTAFGIAGTHAKTLQDSMPYWLSSDGRIYRGNGYQPERISDYGIENSIRTYSDISDCRAFEWTENGHRFVAFNFPTGGATWVFDSTTNMWHERSSGFVGGNWNIATACAAFGKVYFGSTNSGKIGELDLEIFTEFGENMKARRTTPVIHAEQQEVFTSRLELVMQSGFVGNDDEPKVALRWSDDGGVTYGNYVERSIGEIGEYNNRITYWRLGQAKNRVYDLFITDDNPPVLIDTVAEIEAGSL